TPSSSAAQSRTSERASPRHQRRDPRRAAHRYTYLHDFASAPTLPTRRELYRKEVPMAENTWPLKNKLPEGYQFFTKADLLEFLSEVDDETPIWLNNYWQPVRQITQRPMEFMAVRPDGVHIA